MSWTKLDDLWTEQMEQTMPEDFADRWHYLAMIQRCSRVEARDGIIPTTVAERCSDHPDPRAAITRLANLGLVVHLGKNIKLVRAEQHVISEAKAEETRRKREDQRRSRSHREGDHEHCVPGRGDKPKDCRHASPAPGDVTGDTGAEGPRDTGEEQGSTPNLPGDSHLTVTGDVGTGRDGQGQREDTPSSLDTPKDAPGPAELFGDDPVKYSSAPYDAAHWNEPAPIPAFTPRSA